MKGNHDDKLLKEIMNSEFELQCLSDTEKKSILKVMKIYADISEDVSLVMSPRLRKEIQDFVLQKWDTEKDCNQAVKFADSLMSGISCEEISET